MNGNEIREKIDNNFNVNSFFSRKTSRGSGLTDVLTIGGFIIGIFVNPIGWVAVGASELLKILNRKSMDEQYKRDLIEKVSDIVDRNAKQISQQAEAKFESLSDMFKAEMSSFYDDLINTIRNLINEEVSRIEHADETIKYIDSLLN